jgi:predicted dienelactone hydrolase
MYSLRYFLIFLAVALPGVHAESAFSKVPHVGFVQVVQIDGGVTSVFYPTDAQETQVRRGPFELSWAKDAEPAIGNKHLIVISHGSGGSPWVHADLARTLVERGFIVALPQHKGDNYLDGSKPGPESWIQRPIEVSRAIDAVASQPQMSSILTFDAVGVFGGSAGGHTALTLAGGEWSSSRFRDYCENNLERDFSSCVGFTTLLHGNWIDNIKVWLARHIISWRFSDETIQRYADPRIQAAVAMVPFAADFVPHSLAFPRVPLGLVIAGKDVNQIPTFHVDAVRKECEPRCTIVMNLAEAGHGAMLSPMPPLEKGSIASFLLSDPPLFDRAADIPRLNGLIADFFVQKLIAKN